MVNNAVRFSAREGIPASLPLSVLEQAETLFKDLERLGGDRPELKFREAIMLIRFAHNYGILGNTTVREQHAQRAVKILSELIETAGERPELMNLLAWGHSELGRRAQDEGRIAGRLRPPSTRGSKSARTWWTEDPGNADWLQQPVQQPRRCSAISDVIEGDLTGSLDRLPDRAQHQEPPVRETRGTIWSSSMNSPGSMSISASFTGTLDSPAAALDRAQCRAAAAAGTHGQPIQETPTGSGTCP